MLRTNAWARWGLASLATSKPFPIIAPAIWVVFPPGAAHKSNTR
jgi:hypothetical protein